MIPTNRPVLGKDLASIKQQYGLLTADACWLFGLSITRWTQIVNQASDVPVKDPTLALLVRFLGNHPELSVIPKFPGVAEMYEMLNSVQEIDQKRFSVLFGSEASATYRWLRVGSRQSPAVNRLMHYMRLALLARAPHERLDLLNSWRDTVSMEAATRGSPDVFRTGQWNPRKEKPVTEKPAKKARKTATKTARTPAAAKVVKAPEVSKPAAPAKKVVRRIKKAA